MFGWKPEEVIGRFSPIVPEDEREDFLGRLRLVAAGEPMQDIDVRRVHREGALIDINMSAAPIHDAQGNAAGVIASMIDVTARKRSERMLAASEGRKDAILRAAHDSVVIVDHEGLVVEVNPATEEMFGWTRSEALGRQFLELVVAPEHRSELEKVLRSGGGSLLGARLEINALRSDQRSFPAEAAITRVDLPGPQLFAVSLRDVTKRRDREQRLRQAEAKYRALVEQLPHATYVNSVGLPLQTTFVSPQIETMLGYAFSRWLQPGFFASVVHPEDRERVLSEVERTHTTSETFRLEYRLLAADGRVVWVLDETVAIRDEEYRPIMLQGSLVDVSERHAAESQPTLRAAAS
jgi:PAS domain S-box-containing protein